MSPILLALISYYFLSLSFIYSLFFKQRRQIKEKQKEIERKKNFYSLFYLAFFCFVCLFVVYDCAGHIQPLLSKSYSYFAPRRRCPVLRNQLHISVCLPVCHPRPLLTYTFESATYFFFPEPSCCCVALCISVIHFFFIVTMLTLNGRLSCLYIYVYTYE